MVTDGSRPRARASSGAGASTRRGPRSFTGTPTTDATVSTLKASERSNPFPPGSCPGLWDEERAEWTYECGGELQHRVEPGHPRLPGPSGHGSEARWPVERPERTVLAAVGVMTAWLEFGEGEPRPSLVDELLLERARDPRR